MRCTYSSMSLGRSKLITCFTLEMSRPRAATCGTKQVETCTKTHHVLKRSYDAISSSLWRVTSCVDEIPDVIKTKVSKPKRYSLLKLRLWQQRAFREARRGQWFWLHYDNLALLNQWLFVISLSICYWLFTCRALCVWAREGYSAESWVRARERDKVSDRYGRSVVCERGSQCSIVCVSERARITAQHCEWERDRWSQRHVCVTEREGSQCSVVCVWQRVIEQHRVCYKKRQRVIAQHRVCDRQRVTVQHHVWQRVTVQRCVWQERERQVTVQRRVCYRKRQRVIAQHRVCDRETEVTVQHRVWQRVTVQRCVWQKERDRWQCSVVCVTERDRGS